MELVTGNERWIASIEELRQMGPQPDGTRILVLPQGSFLINPTPIEEKIRLLYIQELNKQRDNSHDPIT